MKAVLSARPKHGRGSRCECGGRSVRTDVRNRTRGRIYRLLMRSPDRQARTGTSYDHRPTHHHHRLEAGLRTLCCQRRDARHSRIRAPRDRYRPGCAGSRRSAPVAAMDLLKVSRGCAVSATRCGSSRSRALGSRRDGGGSPGSSLRRPSSVGWLVDVRAQRDRQLVRRPKAEPPPSPRRWRH